MSTAADRQARSDSLKRQFLDRAKSLANLAEVYRSSLVTELLTEALASGLRIETEIFQEAYGKSGRTILARTTFGAHPGGKTRLRSITRWGRER